jgi:anthraniloyl-CoA monooxygenase
VRSAAPRSRPLEIVVIGAGPAGLYFSVLAKQANPGHRITVHERNRAGDTFGFGVVFSENTMGFISEQDARNYPEIMAASRRWDPLTVVHGETTVRCRGVGFAAIGRHRLLRILQGQAIALGVELRFESELPPGAEPEADLIVIADGVNSWQRTAGEREFGTSVEVGPTRFVWLGSTRVWDSLTFFFERNQDGAFGAHVYPYADDRSTFIVETDEETWRRAGMASFSEQDTIDYCERLFARHLDGHRLLSNRSIWQQFRTVRNRRWHHGNRVLIGDAAHTAHFSVGSGTKMAMEDALALSQQLERLGGDVPAALVAFEEERRPRVEHIQRMAAKSLDWWASFRHYLDWKPYRFTFHLLTRSLFRYDTLRERDPGFLAAVEAEVGEDLSPRIASTGAPEPGAGLVLLGSAPVSSEGRITPADVPVASWRPALVRARRETRARIGLQLLHAGPRGACRPREEGVDLPLPAAEAWPLVSASPLPYAEGGQVPRELDQAGMARVAAAFAASAASAAEVGFDWLELQFGHGYLLGAFISPLTNRRSDAYGGPLGNRLAFPLRVLREVRRVWPRDRLLSVAVSVEDHRPGGTTVQEALEVGRCLREAGADCITVLSGQTVADAAPPFDRCFNLLSAGKLKNEAGVPTMATGGITDLDDARTVLLSGRADYVRLDRVRLSPVAG